MKILKVIFVSIVVFLFCGILPIFRLEYAVAMRQSPTFQGVNKNHEVFKLQQRTIKQLINQKIEQKRISQLIDYHRIYMKQGFRLDRVQKFEPTRDSEDYERFLAEVRLSYLHDDFKKVLDAVYQTYQSGGFNFRNQIITNYQLAPLLNKVINHFEEHNKVLLNSMTFDSLRGAPSNVQKQVEYSVQNLQTQYPIDVKQQVLNSVTNAPDYVHYGKAIESVNQSVSINQYERSLYNALIRNYMSSIGENEYGLQLTDSHFIPQSVKLQKKLYQTNQVPQVIVFDSSNVDLMPRFHHTIFEKLQDLQQLGSQRNQNFSLFKWTEEEVNVFVKSYQYQNLIQI